MSAPMWKPTGQRTNMSLFREFVNKRHGLDLKDYWALHAWSTDEVDKFWHAVWDWTGVKGVKEATLFDASAPMDKPNPRAIRATLNYAENLLLSHPSARSSKPALISLTEPSNPCPQTISFAQLWDDVAAISTALRRRGIKAGDAVAAFSPNNAEAVEALLGCAAVGAVWSSCPTEFGTQATLDRLTQIEPKVLFTADSYLYGGKVFKVYPKLQELLKHLPSVKTVVVVGQLSPSRSPTEAFPEQRNGRAWISWRDLLNEGKGGEMQFYRGSAMHPLWVLYSSGTTGKPKAIIHSAGGMVLHSKMVLALHGNLSSDDVYFQYTTLGWMMHQHAVGHLGLGAAMVCYDGSPLLSGSTLWDIVLAHGVTVLGISPRYLQSLDAANFRPKAALKGKGRLHTVLTTGSPLKEDMYTWVWENIGSNIFIHNISGGSDICGVFVGGCQELSFHPAEIQTPVLGMRLTSWGDDGEPSKDGVGNMVISKPFPNQPLGFWGDAGGKRYHEAYYEEFGDKAVWCQGDYIAVNPNTRGVAMLGRSDNVLNPSGIRFGSAEIYAAVEELKSVIEDCIVVAQKLPDGDERVVLFVKSPPSQPLDEGALKKIKDQIRGKLSARHVPAKIIPCPRIPYTGNGKRLEVPVKKLVNGVPLSKINTTSAEDPKALEFFTSLPELRLDGAAPARAKL